MKHLIVFLREPALREPWATLRSCLVWMALAAAYMLVLLCAAGLNHAHAADQFAVAEPLPDPGAPEAPSCARVVFLHVRQRPFLPGANDIEIDALWLHVAKLEALLLTLSEELLEVRRCVDLQAEGASK